MRKCLATFVVFLLVPCARAQDKPPVRVAVYVDGGTSAGKDTVLQTLAKFGDFKADTVKAQDIRDGKLKDYRVLIVPGGSGSAEAKALGEKGREEIKSFVSDGGNYVGICAGSYLATSDYEWSLGILNAKVVDRKHWARGHGPVQIAFTDSGKAVLGTKDDQAEIVYWQGPLLAPGDAKDVARLRPWPAMRPRSRRTSAPKGVMKSTVAIAAGTFGKGRVLCFSPHPEKTDATHYLLKAALQWLKEPVR